MQKSYGRVALVATGICLSTSVAAADVRVIHASPDTPGVDVYVNGTPGVDAPALANLQFRQASPYVSLPTGNYNFQVTPNGLSSPVAINADAFIDENIDITIAAVGFFSNIAPLILIDDRETIAGVSKVRFVHASPDAPAVDIFAAGVTDPIFSNFSFTDSSTYLELGPGLYDLEVRLAGGGATVLTLSGLSLDGGTNYSVFAVGSVAEGSLDAQIFVDAVIPSPGALGVLALGGVVASRRRRSA